MLLPHSSFRVTHLGVLMVRLEETNGDDESAIAISLASAAQHGAEKHRKLGEHLGPAEVVGALVRLVLHGAACVFAGVG